MAEVDVEGCHEVVPVVLRASFGVAADGERRLTFGYAEGVGANVTGQFFVTDLTPEELDIERAANTLRLNPDTQYHIQEGFVVGVSMPQNRSILLRYILEPSTPGTWVTQEAFLLGDSRSQDGTWYNVTRSPDGNGWEVESPATKRIETQTRLCMEVGPSHA